MSYNEIWLFFEGDDDDRFLKRLIVPLLERENRCIRRYPYAQRTTREVKRMLQHVQRRGADYIFFRDIHSCPCATKRKEELDDRYTVLDLNHVVVVVLEIESWYLAGVNSERGQKLGLRSVPRRTDDLSKEKFNSFRPSHYRSNTTFMSAILDGFSVSVARNKNRSFRYFMDKYNLCR